MSKIAFIYPGQGAQSPMMGKEMVETFSEAKEIFDIANDHLDFNLYDLCHTENDLLNDTAYTQPALLAVSIAITEVIESYGIKPDYTAGLSLGEYSALVASGVMDYKDAVAVVRKRGQLMQKAGSEKEGAMAAIIGSSEEAIQAVLDQIDGYVAFANFNNPKQIVLSGEKNALELCYPLFEAAKIKAIPLKVSGAFHSELMSSAAEGLADVLDTIDLDQATIPYLTNVTGGVSCIVQSLSKCIETIIQNLTVLCRYDPAGFGVSPFRRTHCKNSVSRGIPTRHQRRPAWSTVSCRSIGLVKNHALTSQSIQVWGLVKIRSHKTHIFPAKIICYDKDNIWVIGELLYTGETPNCKYYK